MISIERGHDPRDFTLVSFGGAGGLHAVDLARNLNIPEVLIPPQAATLSALGMLMTDVVKDYAVTVMYPEDIEFSALEESFSPLLLTAKNDVLKEKITEENIQIECSLDIRYQGQSFELNIKLSPNFKTDFHKLHNSIYGYQDKNLLIEIVNLRVKAIGKVNKPELEVFDFQDKSPDHALMFLKDVHLHDDKKETPFYNGEKLHPGNQIIGPAIIIRKDTTILIENGDIANVDKYKNLIITVKTMQAGADEI